MKKTRKILLSILICVVLLTVSACSQKTVDSDNLTNTNTGEIKKYSVGSGSLGGNFYLFGGGIATSLNKHLANEFMFTSETTGGGTANLTMLQRNDAELGVAMTSSLAEAHEGKAEWTTGIKHDKVRTALSLYPSWLTLYTKVDSGIETLADVEGKIIGVGGKGMAMDVVYRQFFKDRGIEPKQIHNDGHGATATALKDGVIDIALVFAYPPFPAISELESTEDLKFISLTADEQEYLTDKYSYLSASKMPGGIYKGAPEDTETVSEWNMLASSSDVPQEDVYKMVKSLLEHQEDMIAVHPSAKHMTGEETLNSNIYLHAGTVQYLKEIGIDVPDELIPPEYK